MQEDRDSAGRFLPGNRIWEASSSKGANPIFPEPEDLRAAAVEYFDWTADNPLLEEKVSLEGGRVTRGDVSKMQAMTITGLCLFLGISRQGWYEYRAKPDFADTCEWIEGVIWQQKFSGAAAGLLNHAIVARELGLADKRELSGPGGGPIETEEVSPRDRIARKLARLAPGGEAPGGAGRSE